jgi:hypothetical protein
MEDEPYRMRRFSPYRMGFRVSGWELASSVIPYYLYIYDSRHHIVLDAVVFDLIEEVCLAPSQPEAATGAGL